MRRVGKHWSTKPHLIVHDDGREVCNLSKAAGKREYTTRIHAMLKRQAYRCCNCRLPLVPEEATFEHENGRGAGKHDDRIEVNGRPQNGASHRLCNFERGSKRTPIWHGPKKVRDGN